MPAFSVNILCRDNESQLSDCINSLKSLSDDVVIVVDDRTSDNSAGIAKKLTSQFFAHKFLDFATQRNFAISKSKYDWIFSIDPDEKVSPKLVQELENFKNTETPHSAFWIPRHNYIFGKLIKHTNWDPNGIVRLFNKNNSHWQGEIHEQIVTIGTLGKFKSPLLHDNYHSVEEFMTRMNTYTTAEAKTSVTPQNPIVDFFRRYIWHAGFLDGRHGLFLSYLMAIYHLSVWIKKWQLKNT